MPVSRDYLTTTSNFYNKELEKLLENNEKNEFYQKEKGKNIPLFL